METRKKRAQDNVKKVASEILNHNKKEVIHKVKKFRGDGWIMIHLNVNLRGLK